MSRCQQLRFLGDRDGDGHDIERWKPEASMTNHESGVDLLEQQHHQIRLLLTHVSDAPDGTIRQEQFDRLREMLAVHETAEELVVRPITRKDVPNGAAIAQSRMDEENQAKQVLAKLESLGADNAEFAQLFAQFRADVEEHAQHEEAEEFVELRAHTDSETQATMADRIRKAESAAPTHPHPSAKTTTANMVLGPFAAMVDRVRDAVKSATS